MNPNNNPNPSAQSPQHPSSARLVLILGGARSGKSTFAERLALRSGKSVAYIATATAEDEDMRARIKQHQATRPAHWYTVEEPLYLINALRQASLQADVILLDCITLWLANWLFMRGDEREWVQDQSLYVSEMNEYIDNAVAEIESMLRVIEELDQHKSIVIVSNEVGMGVVPPYVSGRLYRDALGRVNQHLASAATCVYLMLAGLGVDIKRLHDEASL